MPKKRIIASLLAFFLVQLPLVWHEIFSLKKLFKSSLNTTSSKTVTAANMTIAMAKMTIEVANMTVAVTNKTATVRNKTVAVANKTTCQAAIILYGIPKSFDIIWGAYLRNIVDANPSVSFSVYQHLYEDVHNLTNPKNNERDISIESPSSIQATIARYQSQIKNYKVVLTSQEAFDEQLRWINVNHTQTFDPKFWTVNTLKNMFRQGNSILEAYKLVQQGDPTSAPTIYIFARSDTYLGSPTRLSCKMMGESTLYLPSWQVVPKDKSEFNDRFAVAGRKAAQVYAHAKAVEYLKFVQNLSRRNWNSERMLKSYLKSHADVEVKLQDRSWAPLLRIRGGGRVHKRDLRDFKDAASEFATVQALALERRKNQTALMNQGSPTSLDY